MVEAAFLIPLLPLLSFALITFWGRHLPGKGSFIAIGAVGWGLVHSLCIFFQLFFAKAWKPVDFHLYDFFKLSADVDAPKIIEIAYRIDGLSAVMLVVVTLVSLLVHVYSLGYMGFNTSEEDVRFSRFYGSLSLFTFSMLVLVMANNFAVVFIAWELVGLCSYFLIGHWFEKDYPDPKQITPKEAAMKAFLTTKVGDLGFIIGLIGLYGLCVLVSPETATFNMEEVAKNIRIGLESGVIPEWALTWVGICLFIGAVGKSAQWPLHTWLPDAMEGPTPVSALIHAATMVAAGVYLVGRIFPILTPGAGTFIAYTGGFTALFAASIAVTQFDIKKVLAYSTISQLGYMILSLGIGAMDTTGATHGYQAGLMHLTTHAMFKACLFLCSGSVIHAMHHALHRIHSDADPQDMRNMGGLFNYETKFGFFQTIFLLPFMLFTKSFCSKSEALWKNAKMPMTFWCMMVATVAISGVPLFSGFISKDAILGGSLYFVQSHPEHFMLVIFGFGAALLTAFYMFRMIYLTFFGQPKMPEEAFHHIHESPKNMTFPLGILACLSLWFVFSLDPTGLGSHGWFYEKVKTPSRAAEVIGKSAVVSTQGTSRWNFSLLDPLFASEKESIKESHAQPHAYGHSEKHNTNKTPFFVAFFVSIVIAFSGIWWARSWYILKGGVPAAEQAKKWPQLHKYLVNKWYFDEIYDVGIIRPGLKFAKLLSDFDSGVVDWFVDFCAKLIILVGRVKDSFDKYIVDGLVDAVGFTVHVFGEILRRLQTGSVQVYLTYITLFAAIVLLLFEAVD